MRYIIIPLLIYLYVYWSLHSFKKLVRVKFRIIEVDDVPTIFFTIIHAAGILAGLILLSIFYW